MQETARLPNFGHLEVERGVLEEDSYVDDILTSHNGRLKLVKIIQGMEEIWRFLSQTLGIGQSDNQKTAEPLKSEEKGERRKTSSSCQINEQWGQQSPGSWIEKAMEEDMLYLLTSNQLLQKKKKMKLSKDLRKEEDRPGTPNPLSGRELLSH